MSRMIANCTIILSKHMKKQNAKKTIRAKDIVLDIRDKLCKLRI